MSTCPACSSPASTDSTVCTRCGATLVPPRASRRRAVVEIIALLIGLGLVLAVGRMFTGTFQERFAEATSKVSDAELGSLYEPEATTPPTVPRGAIMRPTFVTREGELSAGTAFFVALPGHTEPVGLTAHHLFGSAGGLEREVSAAELPAFVQAVRLEEIGGPASELVEAGAIIPLASAGLSKGEDLRPDVAAFKVDAAFSVRALSLARGRPMEGEPVWLFAEVLDGRPADQLLHRAEVFYSARGALRYVFDDRTVQLRATSGAPVLNRRGEVVGMNLGGGTADDGQIWGAANPVEGLRAHLESALR